MADTHAQDADAVFHVHRDPGVWFVLAGALMCVAGAYQWSATKRACLSRCRTPADWLVENWRQGAWGALRLGAAHGVYCVGCCWALMLVMFAAGVAVLWWMAALTAVMVYEKTGRHGPALTPVIGVALLGLSALAFAHPAWLPTPFAH